MPDRDRSNPTDGRIDWWSVIVTLVFVAIAALIIALVGTIFAPVKVKAATGAPAVECVTQENFRHQIWQADPEAQAVLYRGAEGDRFLATAAALFGPAPRPIVGKPSAVGVYVSSDPTQSVLIALYDAGGCNFYSVSMGVDALRTVLKHMGTGA